MPNFIGNNILNHLDPDYTRRILADMIRIRSIIGEEEKLAAYIHLELTNMGIDSHLEEVEPGRPNVYARIKGGLPGKKLHFNGHMDTVPVCEGWTMDPFTPAIQDGRMYGLGSCDMKAGLACILNLLRAIKLSGNDFPGEVSFSAVIDEEAYSKGSRAALESGYTDCDAMILAEPFPGDEDTPIPLGITGKILYDITVKGLSAHGFYPHKGINAIEEAGRILAALGQINMHSHPIFGKGNLCTLKIEGGYQVYSVMVPDRCRFEINRVLIPGETSQSALQDMQELVASLNLKAEVEIHLKPPTYESLLIERDEPIIQTFDKVYTQVMGKAPHYGFCTVITDANVFGGEHHIPCLHLGPPQEKLHKPDEFVQLKWLELTSKMYALITASFLSGE